MLRFFFAAQREVGSMKLDIRLFTGILVGMVVGLHYHVSLIDYLPLLTVGALILILKTVHH